MTFTTGVGTLTESVSSVVNKPFPISTNTTCRRLVGDVRPRRILLCASIEFESYIHKYKYAKKVKSEV